jgi:hypothetical protein
MSMGMDGKCKNKGGRVFKRSFSLVRDEDIGVDMI